MKAKTAKRPPKQRRPAQPAQELVINGRRMVLLEESEYLRLQRKADDWQPFLPSVDSEGNYPADETLAVIVARKIIRRRRRVGLTQTELAARARIRVETLNRIEHGKHSPSVATVEKIDRALKEAEAQDR